MFFLLFSWRGIYLYCEQVLKVYFLQLKIIGGRKILIEGEVVPCGGIPLPSPSLCLKESIEGSCEIKQNLCLHMQKLQKIGSTSSFLSRHSAIGQCKAIACPFEITEKIGV